MADRQRNDVGDEPARGVRSVAPLAVRPRVHDVVAVDEHPGLRRPGHAVTRFRPCREVFPALNAGVPVASIAMLSPVRGLRRQRATRSRLEKVPKAAMATVSSLASTSPMAQSRTVTALPPVSRA